MNFYFYLSFTLILFKINLIQLKMSQTNEKDEKSEEESKLGAAIEQEHLSTVNTADYELSSRI